MIQRLLLLPGMDGTGDLFLDFMRALPESIRSDTPCYPVDVRLNYHDLEKLVRSYAESNGPFVLLAESFSTPLAIAYAASQPPNLKALILCAGFASSPLKGWRRAMVSALIPILPFGKLSSHFIEKFLVGSGASECLSERVQAAVREVKPEVLRYRLRCVLACDAREELLQISVPVLYLCAAEDRLVPRASLEEILRVRPEKKVVEIPGPHLLLQVNPKAAAEAVVAFLQSIE